MAQSVDAFRGDVPEPGRLSATFGTISVASEARPGSSVRAPLILTNGSTGAVSGTVVADGQPEPNVYVSSGTRAPFTDAQGKFLLTRLEPGPQGIELKSPYGYGGCGAEVVANETVSVGKVWLYEWPSVPPE